MTGKNRILATLRGEKTDRVAFWPLMMFFASSRIGTDYTSYITKPEIMASAQKLMVEGYSLDAMSACSDSYHISSDLGYDITYMGNQTPHLTKHFLDDESDIGSLHLKNEIGSKDSRTAQRIEAIRLMKEQNSKDALISGWVEMPFAEVAEWYGVQNFIYLLMDDPDKAIEALEFATKLEIEFAIKQIQAGADIIGCGDAATSLVGPEYYKRFAFEYEKKVIDAIHSNNGLAKLHICGNTKHNLEMMCETGADIMNIDSAVDLSYALNVCKEYNIAVKGNSDPVRDLMNASPKQAYEEARKMIDLADRIGCKYILGAGCELPAAVSDEVVAEYYQATK